MTLDTQKNNLLEEFRHYLEQSKLEQLDVQQSVDLTTLLSEMAALKTEVKTESRQFKNTLDTLTSSLESLQGDNKALAAELTLQHERLEQQRVEIIQRILLEFIDIYDRLTSGLDVIQNYRPVNALFNHSKKKDIRFIERFKEGQQMTTKRFEQVLQRYQVRPVDSVGKLLDPVTMSAVETGHDPKFGNGIVLEELRKGFLFQDQVLRLAEVKVNKIHPPVKSL